MYKIQTLNKIAACGLDRFPRDSYECASSINDADAILVRSQDMHSMSLPGTVKAVARAGAGTNNIPIAELSEKGVVVFNTPGANANAVKELVITGLLLASRPVIAANKWVDGLAGKGDEIPDLAEKGSRSLMNVPFLTKETDAEKANVINKKFVKEASEAGLVNLAGHRLVGGMRASIYNAMSLEGVKALIAFMDKFAKENQ